MDKFLVIVIVVAVLLFAMWVFMKADGEDSSNSKVKNDDPSVVVEEEQNEKFLTAATTTNGYTNLQVKYDDGSFIVIAREFGDPETNVWENMDGNIYNYVLDSSYHDSYKYVFANYRNGKRAKGAERKLLERVYLDRESLIRTYNRKNSGQVRIDYSFTVTH